MKIRVQISSLMAVMVMLCILVSVGWAEQWKISFNGYPGTMELNGSENSYSGRFNLHGNWEQMLDLQVYRNSIFFRRASADQKYLGVIENGYMQGVFTQQGSGRYPWTAERSMPAPAAPIVTGRPTYHPEPIIQGTERNLAFKKTARQSSTGYGGTADRAVDGNHDGNYGANSVTHTDNAPNEWWEVDLGGLKQIRAIKIWNRTDCCSERLSNFYVMISPNYFSNSSLQTTLHDHSIWKHHIPGVAGRETTIPASVNGRYVRIQLAGQNWLSLAEIEVFGIGTDEAGTPTGTWRHSPEATWVITQNPDGSYHAQEHGLGNASGPGHFTPRGSFKIDYVTRDGAVSGYYEVIFSPDGHTATGRVQELTGPKRSGNTNWKRIQ